MNEAVLNLKNLNIGIVGCGWLGIRMARKWQIANDIYTTTTSTDKVETLAAQNLNPTRVDFNSDCPSTEILRWEAVSSLDVLIITVPISTRKDKDVHNIRKRIQNLSKFIGDFDGQIFFMNSTSVYPPEQKEFSEENVVVEDVHAERLLRAVYPNVNILRLGGLMGDDRQLSKYHVSNLDSPVNHVHFADIVAIIEKMIANKLHTKLYNVVAPEHPTKREVISVQRNQPDIAGKPEKGRLIFSNRLIRELAYNFIYPNPKYFHD